MIEDETRVAGQAACVSWVETAGTRRVAVDAVSESVHDEAICADTSTIHEIGSRLAGEATSGGSVVWKTSGTGH